MKGKVLLQIGVIFAICIVCEGITAFLPFAFPASVLSMVVLFLCFLFRFIKPEQIQEASDFLLQNMAFFFIPAGVGILSVAQMIQGVLVQLLLICIVSTVLTFFATAYTVNLVMQIQARWRRKRNV